MIRVHTTRVTCNLRKSRHPHISHLFRHAQIRVNHILFCSFINQKTQRMGSTVSIPNPIVCVERLTIIFVYLSVECTEITTAFADTNRTFEYTVKRCIKNLFICLTATFYLNIAQCFIPDLTSLFC